MSNTLKDTMAKVANAVHKTLLSVSGGKIGGEIGGMPAVKLTTTGRKSGKKRTVMLTSPIEHDGDLVLIASYGGDEAHPSWYVNLKANPEVEIEVGDDKYNATARTATAAERAVLWPQVTKKYKGYAGYQEKTDREIPVVICAKK